MKTVGAPAKHPKPLMVTAQLAGGISLPGGPLALDALLAAAVAVREQLPPAMNAGELSPIEIPIQREPAGRFHLASFSAGSADQYEVRYTHRRFPVGEAQGLMDRKVRRVQINAGPAKSYRIPMEVQHIAGDELRWWCLGDPAPIEDLLGLVHHLGKRRGVGLGRVLAWTVEPCEPWADGFPIVLDGQPLRTLPVDWPGLVEPATAYRTLTYPYWLQQTEQLCAVVEVE